MRKHIIDFACSACITLTRMALIAASLAAALSCATAKVDALQAEGEPAVLDPVAVAQETEDGRLAERERLVNGALALLGQKPNAKVTVNGRTFILDCIGTVSAAYWSESYDIQRDFAKYPGNGVNRLYLSARDWAALHELREPKLGDIIFWSNTYDRNENGTLYDDGLTHAGIVVKVENDGTVHYLHESYSRGVVIAYFNLLHPSEPRSPEGKIWNSPMYLGSNYDKATNPPHWLSGDLWSAFADAGKTMDAPIQ